MTVTPESLCAEASGGNQEAELFLRTVLAIAHAWDDLIDRDKPVADDRIHSAFEASLLTLPANPFYAKWRHVLEPVLLMAIVNWRAATLAERDVNPAPDWAYILRSSYADLLVAVRAITGGMVTAIAFVPKVRNEVHEEGLDGYRNNLQRERDARTKGQP